MLTSAKKSAASQTFEISIPKMMCNHCIGRVRGALMPFALDGDEKNLTINFKPDDKKSPKTATIKVSKNVTGAQLVNAVRKLVALDEGVKVIEKPALLFSNSAKGKRKATGKSAASNTKIADKAQAPASKRKARLR